MIVVADTSPINYLILIGEIDVLPALYRRILIPPSVREELTRTRAPQPVRTWIHNPPEWLNVRIPTTSPDRFLAALDPGERDAILLAEELHASQMVIDESRGRQEAKRRGLPFTGTLGVLQAAAQRGLIDLPAAVSRLRKTNFHVARGILDEILEGHSEKYSR